MPRQMFSAFAQELAKHDKLIAEAFLAAVGEIQSEIKLSLIEAAIQNEDIHAVLQILNLDDQYFARVDRQVRDTFDAGAAYILAQLPKKIGPEGRELRIHFNHRNPRAEAWVRNRSSGLITEILNDQRRAIRSELESGLAAGEGARTIALRLVGRKSGSKRVGGIIGLHSKDVKAIKKARVELSDPNTLGAYMRRASGDNKFPPGGLAVRSAINAGRSLTTAEIDRIAERYADKLLRDRGMLIGRTEAHAAFNAGKFEAIEQAIDSGRIPATAVKLAWQSTPGPRTRDTHRSMHGQIVSWDEAHQSPSGARLRYPGDASLGAPASETVNCRCGQRVIIEFTALAV